MYGVDPAKEGAQAYYDSLFELYASWGVDYIKVDDIAASLLYGIQLDEIQMIRKAIDTCGRPMVLSLSPGPAPLEFAEELKSHANLWRMTDDFWDIWRLLYGMFERCEKWAPHVGAGNWPDCDMLPLGHIGIRSVDGGASDRWTRFTRDEQQTMMTLWAIFRSPLMFGGELRDNDEWTLSLLTNEEVLDALRNGRDARQLYRENERVVWTSNGTGGVRYVALFNTGDEVQTVKVTSSQLGTPTIGSVRDLWNREELGTPHELSFTLAPHASMLLKLSL
jgi:alpha-galactosidase